MAKYTNSQLAVKLAVKAVKGYSASGRYPRSFVQELSDQFYEKMMELDKKDEKR